MCWTKGQFSPARSGLHSQYVLSACIAGSFLLSLLPFSSAYSNMMIPLARPASKFNKISCLPSLRGRGRIPVSSSKNMKMQFDFSFLSNFWKSGSRREQVQSKNFAELELDCFKFNAEISRRIPMAASSSLGGRSYGGVTKTNHDLAFVTSLDGEKNLWGVFDGHGEYGIMCAEHIVNALPVAINDALCSNDGKLTRRLSDAFLQVDSEAQFFLGNAVTESGCTATIALHYDDRILVASLGDSRAVLGGSGGRCHRLTVDHTPAAPQERARIEAAGGTVGVLPGELPLEVSGTGRVFAMGLRPALATARAFGNSMGKTVGVTALPEMRGIALSQSDAVLIIASDGVWEIMDEALVVDTCMAYAEERDAEMASNVLVQACRLMWEERQGMDGPIDDISAVVVFF